MILRCVMIEDRILPPVMRNVAQSCCNRSISCILDLLAVFLEHVHGVISAGYFYSCCIQDFFVHEHCFPEAVDGNCVFFAVYQRVSDQIIIHVRCIIGILCADLINRNYLVSFDKAVCICSVEEEQYVGFRACLKVGGYSGLEGLIRSSRGICYGVTGLVTPCFYGIFEILCVTVFTCEGGGYIQFYRLCCSCCSLRACSTFCFCAGRLYAPVRRLAATCCKREDHGTCQHCCNKSFHTLYLPNFVFQMFFICCNYIIV